MMTGDQATATVTVIERVGDDAPVSFGLNELYEAIERSGGTTETAEYWSAVDVEEFVVVGTTDDQVVESLIGDRVFEPETVVFERAETDAGTAQVVAGSDERGMMYALLELADRVEAQGLSSLDDVGSLVETPDNEVRGVDRFLMGPPEDDWFYDEEFWHYYFARLARARFNRFVLTTGFDTSFMSPPYPFLVDVPGFPDVGVSDRVDESREGHLALLRRIADLSHQYGLEFVFGTWQQRTRSVNRDMQDDEVDQGFLVENLPLDDDEQFTEYCSRGLEALLVAAPEIDGVQLRVNFESGVGDRSTAEEFWRRITAAPAAAAEERGKEVRLDVRAKGLTDNMIRWAQETGVDLTISTKYWCESTGLPYHTTQMRQGELDNLADMNKARRYSYSNLLEKPRYYDFLYRLWVVGTNRLFLWGDPDYARRFSKTVRFGDSVGFEILAPLAMKGGHFEIQESWPLFDDPDLRDYEWEDERYWAWYLLFGRLGYNADTDPEVWERAFRAHFGEAAPHVLDAYESASRVLPLLTAAHLTKHPTNWNWAELDTGGALFAENNYNPRFGDVTYATAEPSDPAVFYRIDEFVTDLLAEEPSGKYTPLQLASWFNRLADNTRVAVDAARSTTADGDQTAEFDTTVLDMQMIAELADYHAEKTRAATALRFYQETDDTADLRDAYTHMRAAIESWSALVDRGEGTYHDDLVFAMGASSAHEGNWADRLEGELLVDLDTLERLLGQVGIDPSAVSGPAERPDGQVEGRLASLSVGDVAAFPSETPEVVVPDVHPVGKDLPVRLTAGPLVQLEDVTLHYRHTDQLKGEFESSDMETVGTEYRGTVPGDYLTGEWDLLVYITATDENGNGVVAPGVFHAEEPAPYLEVVIE